MEDTTIQKKFHSRTQPNQEQLWKNWPVTQKPKVKVTVLDPSSTFPWLYVAKAHSLITWSLDARQRSLFSHSWSSKFMNIYTVPFLNFV